MKELSIKDIKALPKATGEFSAVVTSRPGEGFVATEVIFREDMVDKDYYRVGGRIETPDRFTTVIFDIPKNIQDGKHSVGSGHIVQAIYADDRDFDGQAVPALSGEIDLRFDRTTNTFSASDFHFRTRGTPGVEIHLGKFKITE
ncbi:hypothetical protein V466_01060 [Pseudomonas mandelii PD30]|uniref:Uncharacterized protein n=1 Tax=Pseudomonas mandelii PD30 TaxID=1419583 RepID=A0A059LA81_9PSED|nr:hypothetical protein [Pseudomonas mandelii]KDD71025.1 hypothetical protein V466_01060 [Pseudomonas mandelii PD30]